MKFYLFILSVLSVKSALACGRDYARELDGQPWSKETLEGNYETYDYISWRHFEVEIQMKMFVGWVTIWLKKLCYNGKIPIQTDEPLTLTTKSSTDSYGSWHQPSVPWCLTYLKSFLGGTIMLNLSIACIKDLRVPLNFQLCHDQIQPKLDLKIT